MTESGRSILGPIRYRRAAYRAAFLFACALPFALLNPVSAQENGEKPHWFPGRFPQGGDDKNPGFRQPTKEMRERIKKLPETERKGIELLQRMMSSGMKRAFIAREVTSKADGPQMEQWVRWDPKQGMRRESVQLGGPIFLDTLKKAYNFDPRENRWTMRDSVLARQGRMRDILRRLYEGELKAEVTGEDTVAGRKAYIVSVSPPPGTNGPSRRIWLDRATGTRLKNEEIGPEGRVFVTSYYISIDFKPQFRSEDFVAPANAVPAPDRRMDRRTYKDLAEANRAGIFPRVPSDLPSGFSLREVEVMEFGRRDGGDRKVITLRYGNGITLISLVQSHVRMLPPGLNDKLENKSAAFIPNPRGGPERMYLWRDGDRGYMLFSSLSEEEMKRIASSLR